MEYRQQSERYSDEMDVKIYGTGFVVYRVNNVSENAFSQVPILADGKCYLTVNTQNPYELALYFYK